MNLDLDTWEIINSYFRDIPNYLVRHHIDSYNDFVQQKIPQIMSNLSKVPPIILLDKEDRTITYEIKVFYGGKNHDKYTISKPTIINYPSGDIRQLFPNETRLKDLTYGADISFDVDVEFTMKKDDEIILDKAPSPHGHIFKNIYIGKIPIMLKSDLCVLSTANGELLTQMGEDKYDLGGYFIIDGAEKVIVSQERKAENIIFLNTVTDSSGTERYTHFAEVKCVSDEAFANARTVKIQLERNGPITVRLGQNKAFLNEYNKRDVPLFIMFRALGVESDFQILQYIIGELKGELAEKMMILLRPSILDPFIIEDEIYDKERAETYLVKLPTRAKIDKEGGLDINRGKKTLLSFLYSTFTENLFPHITSASGNINKAKAYYLGYITRRLLLLKLGLESDTDRDSFNNKRIDLSGFLMATLFRDAIQQIIYKVRENTNREYTFNSKDYSGQDKIVDILNETNINKIFDREVFKKHFNGALKKGKIGQKDGIVQALDRGTRNLTIAHLRRIIDNIAGGRATDQRRRLHSTQYGCVCPIETPGDPGLSKGLAIISHITFGCKTKPIIDFVIKEGLELLDDLLPNEIQNLAKVFVNGNWIGCHRNPEYLNNIFRLYRRNGLINIFISIAWECSTNEIIIFTDGGRFVRPLYIIENNDLLLQPHHIRDIQSKQLTFTDLISGFRKRNEKYNYYSCDVKNASIIGLKSSDVQFIEKMRETQSVIEYIDSQELNNTLLALNFNISPMSLQKYTHTELHPSMFLSFNAHLLPFTEHNAAARAVFASKHVKQGISTYAMNFNNRIDTSAKILNYPQHPITQSRLHNAITHNKFGQGQNLFVALVSYNYNQEDSIIGNQSVIDMGLFHTSHYKMYRDHEMTDSKTGEEHRFYNQMFREEMSYPEDLLPIKRMKYEKIDKYGFPKKGVFLNENDIVIGKYAKIKDDNGNDKNIDMSTTTKIDNNNSFIDNVYTWQTNSDGDRAVKIRTCINRPPVMGDKFTSRCGQKGTFGITLRREDLPYTEDGIIPDIILDPIGYHKRMTIGQLFEIFYGNLGAELGFMGCYNAFETINIEQVNDILENKLGMTSWGDRILYNGQSGEQMHVKIFSGIVHYQRIKDMVDDKINTRLSGHRENGIPIPGGAYTIKERQSVSGRANGGGLKFGEMERDALVAHGIWGFFKESYIERCDKFIIHVSKVSGEITIANTDIGLYYDNITDGIASYQLLEGVGSKGATADRIIGLNIYNQKTVDFIQLVVPYAFKLLVQEIQGMCMSIRFDVSRLRKYIPDIESSDSHITELNDDDIDTLMDADEYYEPLSTTQNGGNKDIDGDDDDDDDDDDGDGDDDDDDGDDGDDNEDGGDDDNIKGGGGDGDDDNIKGGGGGGDDDNIKGGGGGGDSNSLKGGGNGDSDGDNITSDNLDGGDDNSDNLEGGDIAMQDGGNSSEILTDTNMQIQNGNIGFHRANLNSDIMPNKDSNNFEVLQDGGNILANTERIDLSRNDAQFEFNKIQREDDKSIENLNAQLLGLQTGGNNEILENAKSMGINQILNNNMQQGGYQQGGYHQGGYQQNQSPGLNIAFNNNNQQQLSNMQGGNMQGSNMQGSNMQGGNMQGVNMQGGNMQGSNMQGSNMQGGNMQSNIQNPQFNNPQFNNPQKTVSFDSNIKIVELDTRVKDGFLYGGSKNLDPFSN